MKTILLIFMIFISSCSYGENMISEVNAEDLSIDPTLLAQESERKREYDTFSAVERISRNLNIYYAKNGKYPNYRSFSKVALNQSSTASFISDGFGDPIYYTRISEQEVWLHSLNVYEIIDGEEKVSIFKLIKGKMDGQESFEP